MTEQSRKIRENFHIFGLGTFALACFYTFCMYKNSAAVTYPLFVFAIIAYIRFCAKQLEIEVKKGTLFYEISALLLGISTFCTADYRIITMNKIGVFLLVIALVLYNVYDTTNWGFVKYISSIFKSVLMAIGELATPFRDAYFYCKNKMGKTSKTVLYVIVSVLVSIPVFCVVLGLLVSADAVFGEMTTNLLSHLSLNNMFGIGFRIVFMFFLVYGILAYTCKGYILGYVEHSTKAEPLLAIPMAGLLTALYLVFSGVQIAGLFMGKLELPDGYSYAEYAREGFFQLLLVSVLNLIIVLVGIHFFKKNRVLDVLLTMMSLCTFIMIASSAMRMILYITEYDLTFLRIFVLWALFVLTVLFVGVIVNLYKEKFPLFRYSMVAVTVCYLVLSFSHPDYWIAKYNIEKAEQVSSVDYYYLRTLSADAAPVLMPYVDEEDAERLWYDEDANSIRKFNVSQFIANNLF